MEAIPDALSVWEKGRVKVKGQGQALPRRGYPKTDMRSILVKLPDEIAARMEGEAQTLHRDVAELTGERLAERYAAESGYTPRIAPLEELPPLTALRFDTAWTGTKQAQSHTIPRWEWMDAITAWVKANKTADATR